MISKKDAAILRDFAKRVAEIADDPVMEKRRNMWKLHHSLKRVRPMILVIPPGEKWSKNYTWRTDLVPESALLCQGSQAREIEWELRKRIYRHDYIHDDYVIEKTLNIYKKISDTGWGLVPENITDSKSGAYVSIPLIHKYSDLKKIKFPEIIYDQKGSIESFNSAQEVLGDILRINLKGKDDIDFHLIAQYCRLRGLEQAMRDMYDEPSMIHEAMSILEEGNHNLLRQYEQLNLLSLNNDNTHHGSCGIGYTDELPLPGYNPQKVRLCDQWVWTEAQDLALVSPSMSYEFSIQYEKRLAEKFGLTMYGCCEDLKDKLDYLFTIKNLKKISISPWADVAKCAEKIKDRYVMSWRPNPSRLIGEFNEEAIRKEIKNALDLTKDCIIEIVMKDIFKVENFPERITLWTDIAQEMVRDY